MDTIEKSKICSNCGAKSNAESKYCVQCGSVLSENNITKCPKCNKENEMGVRFCSECGYQLKAIENTNVKSTPIEEKIPWNFSSRFIQIAFLICAIISTYLFMSPGFTNVIFKLENGKIFGIISLIIGALVVLIPGKEKFNLDNDLKKLKSLKLTKVAVGLIFIIAGFFMILSIGEESVHSGNFITPSFILFAAFVGLISAVLIYNPDKLNGIGSISSLLASIMCFGASALLNRIRKRKKF